MSVAEVFPSEIVLFRMRRDQIGGPPIAGVVQAMQLAGDALRLSTRDR
jgi:hypothetical protein